ncbi:choline monooxygenase [Legionella wadsworthii]|uniref:Choline monooxygenase n=1 Tax=Legionella wadsworthii TaxID=28088 RepID=A0A378LS42_9GAMM|nr:SRPBCC family protein [Legionella wadsworthii]STY28649.1 choline monooxygenase [Legionella wadsworthii]
MNRYQPIPIQWYFDPSIYELEKENLFKQNPQYVGHHLMVPNLNDYYVLKCSNDREILIHHENGISLLSNICRHRQALLLSDSGNVKRIRCPIHSWSYSTQGELIHAPHFEQLPCLNLAKDNVSEWNGLLFRGNSKIQEHTIESKAYRMFDFSDYVFAQSTYQHYSFNWKIFMEVFLDNYHIPFFHNGLRRLVDVNHIEWTIKESYSIQYVDIQSDLTKFGTDNFKSYQNELLAEAKSNLPRYGAVWMAYYPNIMIEYYPYMIIISTIYPVGVAQCMNIVEFFHPKTIWEKNPGLCKAAQEAYLETAKEDEQICTRINEGRKALYEQGENQYGPYQFELEAALPSFYDFLTEHINR